jgi:hypothetical protein
LGPSDILEVIEGLHKEEHLHADSLPLAPNLAVELAHRRETQAHHPEPGMALHAL